MLLTSCSTEATSPQRHSYPPPGHQSRRLCPRPSPRPEDTPPTPIIPTSPHPSTCCLPQCQPMELHLPPQRITRTWSATTQIWYTTTTTTKLWMTIATIADVVRPRVIVVQPRLHYHQQLLRFSRTPTPTLTRSQHHPVFHHHQQHGLMEAPRRRLPRLVRLSAVTTTPATVMSCHPFRFFPTAVIIPAESTTRQRRSRLN